MDINLCHKNKAIAFAIGFALLLSFPIYAPALRLYFFAPPIIITLYQRGRVASLWYALFSGLCVDFFVSDYFIGMNALSYTVTALILHGQRKNFFADSVSTLPIMTFFFSVIAGLSTALLTYVFHGGTSISYIWAFSDLLIMPLLDSIYAFLVYILPALMFGKPRRRGSTSFSADNFKNITSFFRFMNRCFCTLRH